MPTVDVNGQLAFFRRHPPYADEHAAHKPPVVLVHGAGGTLLHWPPRLRRLPGHTVIAPDLPGHGQSAGQGADSIATYGTWVVAFLNALDIERAVLVGHSMGGAIALDVAYRHPTRVHALTLIGAGSTLPVAPSLFAALQTDFAAATARLAQLVYGRGVTANEIAGYVAQLRAVDPQLLVDDLRACDAFDMRAQLGALAPPTLILAGAEDRMTPVALNQALHQGIRNSSLQIIDGAGHMVMREREAAVMAALDQFLASECDG